MFLMLIMRFPPSTAHHPMHGPTLAPTRHVMVTRISRRLIPTLLLLALLGVPFAPVLRGAAQAQGTSPGTDPGASFEDEVSVGYVLVPVVVRRNSGGYAKNLDEKDFKLLVDGRRVDIDSFEQRAEAPASIVFLQDLSGSMETGGKMDVSRRIVRFFLDRAQTGDEFSVATFAADRTQVEVPFTTDVSAVREEIEGWKGYGKTALHDAVAGVPRISGEGRNPKRFAVLVTDGVDNASHITPEDARRIVREAQLPVYVLGMGSGSPFEIDEEGEKIYRYADLLNLLAHETGGQYFPLRSPEDLEEALKSIEEDLRHQYVLGFPTGNGRSRFRDLKVQVAGKNRSILFRKGYKGPPPADFVQGG
jgi:Ca-activated chloride channel family protein